MKEKKTGTIRSKTKHISYSFFAALVLIYSLCPFASAKGGGEGGRIAKIAQGR